MDSRDVRRIFLEFFAGKGHQIVPSSPLILPSDPTLLFANAGMNQFKEVFRGRESRPYVRAASSQKCLRVSGKHNDLEEVGRTPRHHTFFEMLGNFSFGEYFKKEAIRWAWELMVEEYHLEPERLLATVFRGDGEFPFDEEAAELWRSEVGLPEERIIALGRKDNFWQMGDTGPAGPCSELHYDLQPGGPAGQDPASHPDRFLEIWNLVFMQYDLQRGGGAEMLPAPCVDTGAGLERLTAVLAGVGSNYDTDLFQPIILPLAEQAGVRYGEQEAKDVSLRVIADHLRAITMLVAEGVIPGPEKRGAVLRRILRRALRHGRLLEFPVPFLSAHLSHVVETLGESFPDLRQALPVIEKVVGKEEERFDRTLADGFEKLEERIDILLASGEKTLPGEEAFVLESERGLPLDLIKDALEERGLAFDEAAYAAARRQHVLTSRAPGQGGAGEESVAYLEPWQGRGSRFVGYEAESVEAAPVLALFKEGAPVEALEAGEQGEVLLETTPFYAESGGQVGDRGLLSGAGVRAVVRDTISPLAGVILHRVAVEQGRVSTGSVLSAVVDGARRAGSRRNHTATHLLHAALRQILGFHVRQSGSRVTPGRLRFDFSHYEAVSGETLGQIEAFVNEAVMADEVVETAELSLEQALESGAIAFFGDRYGERVRVVRIGEVSIELCGGTHVARTGQIGPCRIVSERGVAAGVRRLEAVTGPEALAAAGEDRRLLQDLASRLGSSGAALIEGLDRRLDRLKQLQKETQELRLELARGQGGAEQERSEVRGVGLVTRRAEGIDRGQRRDLADTLRQQNPGGVIVLAAADGGKASLLVAVGEQVREKVDAREMIRKLAPLVGGGGGGRADLAEAGGKNPGGLDAALAAAPAALEEILGE